MKLLLKPALVAGRDAYCGAVTAVSAVWPGSRSAGNAGMLEGGIAA